MKVFISRNSYFTKNLFCFLVFFDKVRIIVIVFHVFSHNSTAYHDFFFFNSFHNNLLLHQRYDVVYWGNYNTSLSSPHYILSGLILHQNEWRAILDNLKLLRKSIFEQFQLKPETEFHTTEIFRVKSDEYWAIKKNDRVKMLKFYVHEIPGILLNAKLINICFNKADYPMIQNFQEFAWNRLLRGFDLYLKKTVKDKGIIICDESNESQLRNQLRSSRTFNPSQTETGMILINDPVENIVEDISHRKSTLSYFIQTCDVIAHCLYRKEYPKGSLKKLQVEKIFDSLLPLLLKEANLSDPFGIVRQ